MSKPWRNLNLLRSASSLLTIGIFIAIIRNRLDIDRSFPRTTDLIDPERWVIFVAEKPFAVFLAFSAVCWLLFWRNAYSNEHGHLMALFARGRVPREFSSRRVFLSAAGLAIVFNSSFLLLCYFVVEPLFFCLLALAVLIVDVLSSNITRKQLMLHMRAARFKPSSRDEYAPFIAQRRSVALAYFLERPHHLRQSVMLAAMSVSVGALYARWPSADTAVTIAVVAIIGVVFSNEAVVWRWRRNRDKLLSLVDEQQELYDQKTYGFGSDAKEGAEQ